MTPSIEWPPLFVLVTIKGWSNPRRFRRGPARYRPLFSSAGMYGNFEKVITDSHLFSHRARILSICVYSACLVATRRSGWKTAFSGGQCAM